MTHQTSFSQAEFADKKKITRREKFLGRMEEIIPWAALLAVLKPFYPKGERGRPPIGLERMLRVYFLQQWYGLADEALEDAIYDSQAMRGFARIDLAADGVPDATTLLKFRRLLETNNLCKGLFTAINADLTARGLLLREGTLVDATLLAAPPSTKNLKKERDPEMHQTKKGNQWYFGMKAHIGADSKEGIVHSVCSTAASVSDVHMLPDLLHGDERKVWGDAGYQGQTEAIHAAAPQAQDMTSRRVKIKTGVDEVEKRKNRTKARVRAKVEWPFRIVKRVFGFTKVRYRGLKKNHEWLLAAFALVNLYQHRKRLAPLAA